jgi:hypothetical protein
VKTAGNWRKSSYSGADGGECVEVASETGTVMLRDTLDRDAATLRVSASAWRGFIKDVQSTSRG